MSVGITPAYPFLSVGLAIWLERLKRARSDLPAILATTVILAMMLWVRVEIRSFNPFAIQAAAIQGQVSWWQPFQISPAIGMPVTALVIALALYGTSRLLRARVARPLTYILALALLTLAGIRTLHPLKFTGYQSPTAKLRQDLIAARSTGQPLRYPIPVAESDILKTRFYFGDDFRITGASPGSKASFHLYPRQSSGTSP